MKTKLHVNLKFARKWAKVPIYRFYFHTVEFALTFFVCFTNNNNHAHFQSLKDNNNKNNIHYIGL